MRLKSLYWKAPRKVDVVVFGSPRYQELAPLLENVRHDVLHVHGEKYSIPLVLAAVVLRLKSGKPLRECYLDRYISTCGPKLVLSFIDNDPYFRALSPRFENLETVIIQHGVMEDLDFDNPNQIEFVDHMFVMNAAQGQGYGRKLGGSWYPVGLFRSNANPKKSLPIRKVVSFISQVEVPFSPSRPYLEPNGNPIPFEVYYSAERLVLSALDEFCRSENVTLEVIGRQLESKASKAEQVFFQSHLKSCKWTFVRRTSAVSSYDLIDSSSMVVSITSTLGYESIQRKNKTAVLAIRDHQRQVKSEGFGWPHETSENGPFWTHSNDPTCLKAALLRTWMLDSEEFASARKSLMPMVIAEDPANRTLRKFISNRFLQ